MQELYNLGLIKAENVRPYYPRVRDREDVSVLRDERSGIIFLNRTDHISISHYETMESGSYWWDSKTRKEALTRYAEDDGRRAAQFAELVKNKSVIDIGCGTGGFMDRIRNIAKEVSGVEPQSEVRKELATLGYGMYRLTNDAPQEQFDVATLFHVLEHVLEPLKTLQEVRAVLKPGGTLIVEVPHARDILLKLESFKAFSLWSEHLILHTKESLYTYLKRAGFDDIHVEGYQRHSLGNHVGWLVDGTPGGQKKYTQYAALADDYTKRLVDTDQTDTLIAYAR